MRLRGTALVVLFAFGLTACSGSESYRVAPSQSIAASSPSGRTLTAVMAVEPVSLAVKPLRATGISIAFATRIFNAQLDLRDSRGNPRPYLSESLPTLQTDTWRVYPDGAMETTYRLHPNLTWHDGASLSAEDFVFAWRVYSTPELGMANQLPQRLIQEATAPDHRTLIFRWRQLYPDAEALGDTFQALPRHILEPAYEQGGDAFVNHPFWASAYVGSGPYRLERWEPGAFIQAAAFDNHVLGRPRIERVVLRFASDENTALANLLSGEVQLAIDRSLRFEQAAILKRGWLSEGKGAVIQTAIQARFLHVQLRREFVNPPALLDGRVRQALAHTTDKQALNDGLFGGEGVMSDTFLAPFLPYYEEAQRVVARYAHDVRRAEQLMGEAGFGRSAGGLFVAASGDTFAPELLGATASQQARELALMTEGWQRVGFDIQPRVLSAAQRADGQTRSTFPGLYGASQSGEEKNLGVWTTAGIPNPSNRWQGSNRGAWSNAAYDALWDAFNTELDRGQRNSLAIQMMQVMNSELPLLILYHTIDVTAHAVALRGPDPKGIDAYTHWNVHEWELT